MLVNTAERETIRLLNEGQAAARRGDRAMARALLTQLVEQDPRNEEAWMWLSGVVTDADEQQICLENALVINPYNAHARKGLEFILSKTGTPSRVPLAPPPQVVQQVAPSATSSYTPPAVLNQPEAVEAEIAPPPPAPAAPVATAPPAVEVPASPAYSQPAPRPVEEVRAPAARPVDNGSSLMSSPHEEYEMDLETGFDAQPFVPPGMEEFTRASAGAHASMITPTYTPAPIATAPSAPSAPQVAATPSVLNTTPEQVGDELPNWLQELTPSADTFSSSGNSGPFSPFEMSNYPTHGSSSNPNSMALNTSSLSPMMPGASEDAGGNGANNANVSLAGPYADLQMPMPHELPGGMEGFGNPALPANQPQQNDAQPWYLRGDSGPGGQNGSTYLDSTMLKSASLNSTMLTSSLVEDKRGSKPVVTIECPNCQQQVAETSLACPICGYNFFVNCPHCHELVDTSHCVPGEIDPCPYCEKPVEGWKLGLGGVPDLVSQKNPGSRPVDAGEAPASTLTKQVLDIGPGQKTRTFGWVVDLLWLVAIVAMVWAFTQLPTWFHLSGLY